MKRYSFVFSFALMLFTHYSFILTCWPKAATSEVVVPGLQWHCCGTYYEATSSCGSGIPPGDYSLSFAIWDLANAATMSITMRTSQSIPTNVAIALVALAAISLAEILPPIACQLQS